jgi:uncharacterized protein YqhQ
MSNSNISTDKGLTVRFDPAKPLQVGGQAVIEGVMMRAPGRIATAVRRTDGSIVVRQKKFTTLAEKYKIFKLPILRGAVGLLEMMFVGVETLNFSAEIAMHGLDQQEKAKKDGEMVKKRKSKTNIQLGLTMVFALILGIAIFFVVPLVVTTKLFALEQNAFWFNIVAGSIRLLILFIYLVAISRMKDVKRLFAYHGGEHKAVMTFESQKELTIDSAATSSRFHPRCGTSFILIVVLVAILLFSVFDAFFIVIIGKITLPIRLLTHIPLIPLVGGIAYEFIRWSSRKSDTPLGKFLISPGLWMQKITTREPDPSQIEVALVALRCALGIESPAIVRQINNVAELVEQ